MSEHLSSEQISKWMVGEYDGPQEAHVRECEKCRAAIVGLESTLTHFRQSIWQLGEQQPVAFGQPRQRTYSPPLRWALAATAAAILAMVPLYKNARDRQREAADALLMDQVNAAVSRTVPRPMEPLIELVQWRVPAEGKVNK